MGIRGRKSAAELAITPFPVRPSLPRAVQPPRALGKAGMAMWSRLTKAYDFSADAAAAEILAQACAAADLAEETDDDKLRLQARAFVARTLGRICE
jgi:hypothetical protein